MIVNRQNALCAIFLLCMQGTGLAARQIEPWETSILYQVYPRSFKDSNGDGMGDLKGIIEKLDYIKDIGVDIVWVQPFYKSGGADMGYDVVDYRSVDPAFGTIDDFKQLVKGIHERGMKLMLDYVPNHASDENEWFKLSERRVEPYTDYFVWADPKFDRNGYRLNPNNWISVFGGSAWTWSDKRKQFYLRQFAVKQPDLNFHNPNVMNEMSNVLRFWLDLGVDGFRVDAIKHLVEDRLQRDEPIIGPNRENYRDLNHIYTLKQPENYQITHQWRMLLKEYELKDGRPRLLCVEDYDSPAELARYFGNETYPNVQIPSNYALTMQFQYSTDAQALGAIIHRWVDTVPQSKALPNWAVGNHDNARVSSRYHRDMVDSVNMLLLLLPGLAFLYNGEEYGHEDSIVRDDQRQDPNNGGMGRTDTRDAERGPMIWDDTANAGFTTAEKPWLPVTPHYWKLNVKTQLEEPNSHLKIFKRLVALRKTPVIREGALETYSISKWIFMFIRNHTTDKGSEVIAVILNLGSETSQICAKNVAGKLPDTMTIYASSLNSGYDNGDRVKITEVDGNKCSDLRPKAGLVLTANHGTLLSHSLYLIFFAGFANLLRWTYD